MSRPKPTVLYEYIDPKTGKSEQVLKADGVFIVTYDGVPINLKVFNALQDVGGAKYKKTMFPSKAHADNLAERLNTVHKTNKFSVIDLLSDSTADTITFIINAQNDFDDNKGDNGREQLQTTNP